MAAMSSMRKLGTGKEKGGESMWVCEDRGFRVQRFKREKEERESLGTGKEKGGLGDGRQN